MRIVGVALGITLLSGAACQRGGPPSAASLPPTLALAPIANRAVAVAQAAVRAAPGRAESWVTLAQAFVQAARAQQDPSLYAQARDAVERSLALAPTLRSARTMEAVVLLQEHRFREVALRAHGLLLDQPHDASAQALLADAQTELGQYDQAADTVQRMIDQKPNAASYVRAGWLRWLDGDVEGALEITRLAASASSPLDGQTRAFCQTQLGSIEWARGALGPADLAFTDALTAFPGYAPALIGRARVALALGRPADAAGLLEPAAHAGALPELLWVYADALAAAGRPEASAAAEKILEQTGARLDPRTYALWAASRGRPPAHALALALAETEVRDDLYTEDALAWSYYQSGQLAAARRAADQALARGTRDPRLYYHAGMIAAASGQPVRARHLLATALALNPGFDPGAAAVARQTLHRLTS